MSLYSSTGAALVNAFNPTLFDSYKSAGWQAVAGKMCGKYPEFEMPVRSEPNFDPHRLTRMDWATQAGMVSGMLRRQLSALDFALLRIRYSFDGVALTQQSMSIQLHLTDSLRNALIDGWEPIACALYQHNGIPLTLKKSGCETRLTYLALRAIRPDVVTDTLKSLGTERQQTVNNLQCTVRRVINELCAEAYKRADVLLDEV